MWILFLLLFCSVAKADVYVVTTPDKSVYSLSEQNDAIIPPGYSVDVIKGKGISDLAIGDDLSLYNYNGKKFSLDDKKVSRKNKDLTDASIDRQAKIDAKSSAMSKLKALGLTDAEINSMMGK